MCSKCLPFSRIIHFRRVFMFLITRLRVSSFMTQIICLMFVFNSLMVYGGSGTLRPSCILTDRSHRELSMGRPLAMQSFYFFPPIAKKLSVQVFSCFICLVRGAIIVLGDCAFWIVSKLEKQKIPKHSFVPTSCHTSVFKKEKPDYLLLDKAHHTTTNGELSFGRSLQ